MAYYEDDFSGQTDGSGNATIELGPLTDKHVYFLGYVVVEVGGGQGCTATITTKAGFPLAAASGLVPTVGPFNLAPNDFKLLQITAGPANAQIKGNILGDVAAKVEDLLVRPQPTQAGQTLTGNTFPSAIVTGVLDSQGSFQAEGPVLFKGPDPWASASHPAFGSTGPDGATDNTQQIKNAIAALVAAGSSGGKGTLFLEPGIWTLDPTTVFGVVTQITAAIGWPNGITIRGAGMDATYVRIRASGRLPAAGTLAMFVNSDPDNGNTGLEMFDLTLDGNRLNQGPYTYNISAPGGVSTWAPRLIHFQSCTDVLVDRVKVQNCSFIAVFVEGASRNVKVGTIIGENCTGTVGFDSGKGLSLVSGSAWNHDPALVINTTATTVVAGGGAATVAPASMAGIVVNGVVDIDGGTAANEHVLVTAINPGVSFTGYFANAHGPGAYKVTSPIFASDAAFQCGPGCEGVDCGTVNADYTTAQAIFGPALEVFGCHDIAVGTVRAKGTWKGAWLHNWTVLGVHFIAHDIAVGQVQSTNLQPSWSGLAPIGCHIDDQGYGVGEAIHNVGVGLLVSRYGQGGAAVPAGALAFSDSGSSVWKAKILDYGSGGNVISTQLGAEFELFSYGSSGRGLYAPSVKNTKGRITVINPTLQGVAVDGNPGAQGNDWEMLCTGAPGVFPGFTMQFGANHTNNRFRGNLIGNAGGAFIPSADLSNDIEFAGYNPVGVVVVAVPATGVAVAGQVYDRTFYVTGAAGGPVTMTIQNGPAVVIPANAVVAVFVPRNKTVTPTYGGGNAPTWVVEGQ